MNKLFLAFLTALLFFVFTQFCFAAGFLYYPFENYISITQYPYDDYTLKMDWPTYSSPKHAGTDFKMKFGEPIYAAASGYVVELIDGLGDGCRAGDWKLTNNYYGNHIKIKLDNGEVAVYGHLKKDSVKLNREGLFSINKKILVGDQIGEAGSSGDTEGSDECGTFVHLHFELRDKNGVMINPYAQDAWLKDDSGKILTMADFKKSKTISTDIKSSEQASQKSWLQQIQELPQNVSKSISGFFAGKREDLEQWAVKQIENTEVGMIQAIQRETERQTEEIQRQCAIKSAYGVENNPQLTLFRGFRDKVLMGRKEGRQFVHSYYHRISPPIVRYISRHQAAKAAARLSFDSIAKVLAMSQPVWDI